MSSELLQVYVGVAGVLLLGDGLILLPCLCCVGHFQYVGDLQRTGECFVYYK